MVRNRRIFIPVFLWLLMCTGVFLLALFQERTGVKAIPFLTLQNAFGWITSLLLTYFIFVWPLDLERMVEKYARQPEAQGTYSIMALQEPGLLLLYVFPVLILSGAFGFKGIVEIAQMIAILLVVGLAIWAHFRLGFYFYGSMGKPYFFVTGFLCVLTPAVNLVFGTFYGNGPTWLNALNPFSVIFQVAGPGEGIRSPCLVFCLAFGGVTILLLALPLIFVMTPRVYRDLPG
ncbi:MAG: hypothetical protein ACYTHM_07775 [Planctomycetota bacterium]|jgi:hypothetical protein